MLTGKHINTNISIVFDVHISKVTEIKEAKSVPTKNIINNLNFIVTSIKIIKYSEYLRSNFLFPNKLTKKEATNILSVTITDIISTLKYVESFNGFYK